MTTQKWGTAHTLLATYGILCPYNNTKPRLLDGVVATSGVTSAGLLANTTPFIVLQKGVMHMSILPYAVQNSNSLPQTLPLTWPQIDAIAAQYGMRLWWGICYLNAWYDGWNPLMPVDDAKNVPAQEWHRFFQTIVISNRKEVRA